MSYKSIFSKLKKIKLLAMDCDGVLTDGGILVDNQGKQLKKFNVKDGLGVKLLQKYDIKIALITGSNSEAIIKRAESLGIEIVRRGIKDKNDALMKIQDGLKIYKQETIFLGDDINDLMVLPSVSLFIVPCDAHHGCKIKADYVSQVNGGEGFVREVIDNLLISKNYNPYLPFKTRNDF